jgi:hypothetical protein
MTTARNVNFDTGYMELYVQSATLNGVASMRNWKGCGFYTKGGVLELTFGRKESSSRAQMEGSPLSAWTECYMEGLLTGNSVDVKGLPTGIGVLVPLVERCRVIKGHKGLLRDAEVLDATLSAGSWMQPPIAVS